MRHWESVRRVRQGVFSARDLFVFVVVIATTSPSLYAQDTEKTEGAPMLAEDVARTATLPPGFALEVFASEPMIRQPIAMAFDTRGRLWVAENDTYAENAPTNDKGNDLSLKDRIVILEDTDLDGRADRRTVFYDQLQRLTSILPGLGGVWILAAPELLFIPDADDDLRPDSPPIVKLEGWTTQARHNFVNGLKWGPDGWLYGRNGITAKSMVAGPGTAEADRTLTGPGIWRYHPSRQVFEIYCEGTTNPWGHDWDQHGHLFFINTVIGHLWHAIPGSQLRRMSGPPARPYAYDFLEQHADHFHFDTGEGWTATRRGAPSDATDRLGGGHAHCGMAIYQGNQWPAEYRGKLLTANFHGRRLNVERLVRDGTGYTGRHEPDFLAIKDTWFRGIDLLEDQDGTVLLSDWADAGECHDNDGIHRSSGRIYRIRYGDTAKVGALDLTKESIASLAKLQLDGHEQTARLARVELQTRQASGVDVHEAQGFFQASMANSKTSVAARLHMLWGLHSLGFTDEPLLAAELDHADEQVRTAAVRLLVDHKMASDNVLAKFTHLASSDNSGLVRLHLASALQRLPLAKSAALARALALRTEDIDDHNQPVMLWLGIEPHVLADPSWSSRLAAETPYPLLRRNIARRMADEYNKSTAPLNAILQAASSSNASTCNDLLSGIEIAFNGLPKVALPDRWQDFSNSQLNFGDVKLSDRINVMGSVFGDENALGLLRKLVADPEKSTDRRRAALDALIRIRDSGLNERLELLVDDPVLAQSALHKLASSNKASHASAVVERLPARSVDERAMLVNTLVTRQQGVAALLEAIEKKKLPYDVLNAFHARQIKSFDDPELLRKLSEVWGDVKESSEEKKKLLSDYKKRFDKSSLGRADLELGRQTYKTVCGNCHTLLGEGGKIGPDLTGGNRRNVDYLLENVVDPSAIVPEAYRLSVIETEDGRILTGVVVEKNDSLLVLQTSLEKISLPVSEIAAMKNSPASLMPEGILTALSEKQSLALIAFLMQ